MFSISSIVDVMDSESIVNLEDDVIEFLMAWDSTPTDIDCNGSGNVLPKSAPTGVDCNGGADTVIDVVEYSVEERTTETVYASPVTLVDTVCTPTHCRRGRRPILRHGPQPGATIARLHPYGRAKHLYDSGGENTRVPSYMEELKAKDPVSYWKLKDSFHKSSKKK